MPKGSPKLNYPLDQIPFLAAQQHQITNLVNYIASTDSLDDLIRVTAPEDKPLLLAIISISKLNSHTAFDFTTDDIIESRRWESLFMMLFEFHWKQQEHAFAAQEEKLVLAGDKSRVWEKWAFFLIARLLVARDALRDIGETVDASDIPEIPEIPGIADTENSDDGDGDASGVESE